MQQLKKVMFIFKKKIDSYTDLIYHNGYYFAYISSSGVYFKKEGCQHNWTFFFSDEAESTNPGQIFDSFNKFLIVKTLSKVIVLDTDLGLEVRTFEPGALIYGCVIYGDGMVGLLTDSDFRICNWEKEEIAKYDFISGEEGGNLAVSPDNRYFFATISEKEEEESEESGLSSIMIFELKEGKLNNIGYLQIGMLNVYFFVSFSIFQQFENSIVLTAISGGEDAFAFSLFYEIKENELKVKEKRKLNVSNVSKFSEEEGVLCGVSQNGILVEVGYGVKV